MAKDAGKIRVLSENIINKIAAGEVIDRPASVVKELVENSIDADATQISVIVKSGGDVLIQVVDNGAGMDEQNAILSLQRHATSKIRSFQDIENIRTLGFRGEALASIAAVSRLDLKTVEKGEIEGTQILIEGGVVQRVDKTGGNSGTSISVKNLFFNTPARRKFMRSASTEYRYILSVLNRFTLAYPEIEFQLVHDDNEVFNLKKTSLEDRIGAVLGKRVQENTVRVQDDNSLLAISGFIGNYDIMRRSRNDQYLFLNRRYINDRTINHAVVSAFGESVPKGYYPLFIMFFEIDPSRVDVNVHPTKSEVKFADQRLIYDLVRGAIKRALRTDDIIPDIRRFTPGRWQAERPRFPAGVPHEMSEKFGQGDFDWDKNKQDVHVIESTPGASETDRGIAKKLPAESAANESAMVWQLHNKYILSPIKSGLVVIDQHVAHERILYEKAKKSFQKENMPAQQLLFPQTMELAAQDFQYLAEIMPLLEKIGFIIKNFGGRTVVVEGVPPGMRIGSEEKILLDILDEYKENLESDIDLNERVAMSFACRSAIMAGEKLTPEAMQALIDQLFATENPYFCPHGRPIMITISLEDLDTRFDRK